jgi:hypothetical protein
MATVPQAPPTSQTKEESARELLNVMENYFDDIGLTASERDGRYAALKNSLDAKDDARARS